MKSAKISNVDKDTVQFKEHGCQKRESRERRGNTERENCVFAMSPRERIASKEVVRSPVYRTSHFARKYKKNGETPKSFFTHREEIRHVSFFLRL